MVQRTDLPVGLTIAALGAAIVLAARDLTPLVGAAYGPGLFPTILGVVMIACGLLVAIRPMVAGGRPVPDPSEVAAGGSGPATGYRSNPAAMAWVIGGSAAAIWLFEPLGFIAYCTLLLSGMLLLLRVRPVPAIALSAGLAVAAHFVFVHALLVPLPTGILSFLLR